MNEWLINLQWDKYELVLVGDCLRLAFKRPLFTCMSDRSSSDMQWTYLRTVVLNASCESLLYVQRDHVHLKTLCVTKQTENKENVMVSWRTKQTHIDTCLVDWFNIIRVHWPDTHPLRTPRTRLSMKKDRSFNWKTVIDSS